MWNDLFLYYSVPEEEVDSLAHYDIVDSKVGCAACFRLLLDASSIELCTAMLLLLIV